MLDCPTYFALYPDSHPMSFLAQITARIDAPVRAGTEHVVIAWPIGKDGRKHLAGSAVLSAGGETLAVARALLIEARPGRAIGGRRRARRPLRRPVLALGRAGPGGAAARPRGTRR